MGGRNRARPEIAEIGREGRRNQQFPIYLGVVQLPLRLVMGKHSDVVGVLVRLTDQAFD